MQNPFTQSTSPEPDELPTTDPTVAAPPAAPTRPPSENPPDHVGQLVTFEHFDAYDEAQPGGGFVMAAGIVVNIDEDSDTAVVAWLRDLSTSVPLDELEARD